MFPCDAAPSSRQPWDMEGKYVDDGSQIAGRVCDDEAEEAVEGLAEDDA